MRVFAEIHEIFHAALPLGDSFAVRVTVFREGADRLRKLMRDPAVNVGERPPAEIERRERVEQVAGMPCALVVAMKQAGEIINIAF